MDFCPVEEAIEGFPILLAQLLAKIFPSSTLLLQNMTERHNCSAHIFLQMMVL
jgi:hypothetical protein